MRKTQTKTETRETIPTPKNKRNFNPKETTAYIEVDDQTEETTKVYNLNGNPNSTTNPKTRARADHVALPLNTVVNSNVNDFTPIFAPNQTARLAVIYYQMVGVLPPSSLEPEPTFEKYGTPGKEIHAVCSCWNDTNAIKTRQTNYEAKSKERYSPTYTGGEWKTQARLKKKVNHRTDPQKLHPHRTASRLDDNHKDYGQHTCLRDPEATKQNNLQKRNQLAATKHRTLETEAPKFAKPNSNNTKKKLQDNERNPRDISATEGAKFKPCPHAGILSTGESLAKFSKETLPTKPQNKLQ